MAFLEKLVGKNEEINIEEFLNNLDSDDEDPYENADAFVKPISLQSEADRDLVIEEAKKGNIILLNISDLSKRNAIKLKDLVGGIKQNIDGIDGDMARISSDRILVTPSRVKIIKRREAQ
ncbi:MAG: cell division protein SepF [Candidatus Diapherotrites archaeon]